MEVYKSKYWTMSFENNNKLLVLVWHETTEDMSDKIYKMEMEKYTEIVEQYCPNKLLIDCRKFYFSITPDLQEWINNKIFPRVLAVGVRLVAIVIPIEFITQLSIEQAMEETNAMTFTTAYFDNVPTAREWLKLLF